MRHLVRFGFLFLFFVWIYGVSLRVVNFLLHFTVTSVHLASANMFLLQACLPIGERQASIGAASFFWPSLTGR